MSSFTVAIVLLLVVLFWMFTSTSGFEAAGVDSLCDRIASLQKNYCGPPGTKTSFASFVESAAVKKA
jgi:hypothetical protein